MKIPRIRRRPLLFLLLLVLLGGAGRLLLRADPVPVEVQPAERGDVEEIVTNSRAGSVRARFRAEVGSDTAGRVAAILYREGAEVDSGTVLVRLADDLVRAQVALAERDLEAALAGLAAATARAQLAATELVRTEGLVQRGAGPEEALDAARSRDKSARAEADAALAQVERARAALRLAAVERARHDVRAPFDGVVNDLRVEVGASVVPGQPLLELMSHADIYISAPMDELDIGRIHVGQHARISLDPYRGRVFDATVARVAPFVSEIQEQNRTMDVELRLDGVPEDVVLRPGTSADVEIVLQRREGVLRIPALALLEGERVFVVDGDRVAERQVQAGLRNWDYVEILSGLSEGDEVVTSLEKTKLKAGSRVVVQRKRTVESEAAPRKEVTARAGD